jgi:hypothetical protein
MSRVDTTRFHRKRFIHTAGSNISLKGKRPNTLGPFIREKICRDLIKTRLI